MTGCAAYAMTLSSRGPVAMAVRRCAQVRTALDNPPVLFADVFYARHTARMNRRVARRCVVGRPRGGRPLPDIAGDVVEAVPGAGGLAALTLRTSANAEVFCLPNASQNPARSIVEVSADCDGFVTPEGLGVLRGEWAVGDAP